MIRSTFAGFTMAQQALNASQKAIDVAGQNVSNVNTEGYTRQRLDLASLSPVGSSYSSSMNDNKVGQGVQMTGVTQIRDSFLDIQYRNQMAKVGTADATDTILDGIGNIFDETDSTAIRAALNSVITQLQNMATPQNSGDKSIDALVRSNFEVLLNNIHQNANALDTLRSETEQKMDTVLVANANSCLEKITNLNTQIKNSQIQGNPALELQDQRNQLLDDLASYLPINVTKSSEDIGGIFVDTLQVSFIDTAGKSHLMISDDKAGIFTYDVSEENRMSTLTMDEITETGDLNTIDITDTMANGVFKGNLDMLNKSGIFDDPSSDIKGIGYYEKMFDSFVSMMATKMNDLNAKADGTRQDLFATSDGSAEFTALNIKVSDAWMSDAVNIKKTDTDSSTAYENIFKMINALSSDSHEFKVTKPSGEAIAFNGTLQNCYDNLQNVQAIDRSASSAILKTHMTVLNQIADSKESVSGVNIDDETMDMMRFQQSYNAASRLMTTLDELLDKLINSTGVVGR